MKDYHLIVNLSGEKLMALNLYIMESIVIVANSEMAIYLKYVWDAFVFTGWVYDDSGANYARNNRSMPIAYLTGELFEIFYRNGQVG